MFTTLMLGAMSVVAALSTVYWACLVVGGGLMLLSMIGGDNDADVGVDADFDVDFDADGALDADFDLDADGADISHAHASATSLSTWFSMRFVVFFAFIFGAMGVILTNMTGVDMWIAFGIALGVGLLGGQGTHQIFMAIRRTSGNSTPRAQDYVHRLARVSIAIKPPNKGEVVIQVKNAKRYVPAVALDNEHPFDTGSEVVVTAYRAGVARVISREEFERQARSQ